MAWSSHAIMAGWAPSHGARPDVAVLCERIVVGQRDEMKERGIRHTTSECTLRGFTCAQAKVDPKVASPAEILRMRGVATGHRIDGITGGLSVK